MTSHLRNISTLLLFVLVLFSFGLPVPASEPAATFSGVNRVVAVGDVHGDYDRFLDLIRLAELVDKNNHWSGGNTHLVQTGDILDRGPDSKKVMDLLMALEKEAMKAGGRVHALIGNHEAMNILGDLRYVHPGETASYGGEEQFKAAMDPSGKYGKWIASHNCVVKINDILFVHGGISPDYLEHSLEALNRMVRKELQTGDPKKAKTCQSSDGPLWYRGFTKDDDKSLDQHVENVKKQFDVKKVVVGHTVSKEGIQTRCSGTVIMIDVGISRAYGGKPACLLIESGQFRVLTSAGVRNLEF